MNKNSIRELMVPIEDYPRVREDATLLEAIEKFDYTLTASAHRKIPRAVIVENFNGDIIGKIGQFSFIKAFEPKYEYLDNELAKLSTLDYDPLIIKAIMDKHKLWKADFRDICKRSAEVKVKDVMSDLKECVDINAPVVEAIHKLVVHEVLGLLVKKDEKPVGIIRLFDVYDALVDEVRDIYRLKQN